MLRFRGVYEERKMFDVMCYDFVEMSVICIDCVDFLIVVVVFKVFLKYILSRDGEIEDEDEDFVSYVLIGFFCRI